MRTLFFILFFVLRVSFVGAQSFFMQQDSIRGITIGEQVIRAESFNQDTAAALAVLEKLSTEVRADSARITEAYKLNRSRAAQLAQMRAALRPASGRQPSPTPQTEKDAEIARLRAELEQLRKGKKE